MHEGKIPAGEGLLKWDVLLTPVGGRSEMETMSKSWELTEAGRDREINHSHFLKGVIRYIPSQQLPKKNPGGVGRGSEPAAPRPQCHCKQSRAGCPNVVPWCLNARQTADRQPGVGG